MITELIITKLIITFNNKDVFTTIKIVYMNGGSGQKSSKWSV